MAKLQYNEYGIAKLMVSALEEYEKGATMAKACRDYGLDYRAMLDLIKSKNFQKLVVGKPIQLSDYIKVKDGWERIYDAVFDIPCDVELPNDYIPTVEAALSLLSDRERDIMRCRFFEDMTLEEIGKMQGVNRERIRQIEAKAIRKLRRPETKKMLSVGYAQFERDKRKTAEATKECFVAAKINTAGEILQIDIGDMDLSVRTYNCLLRANKRKIADFVNMSDDELLQIRNMGKKSVAELRRKLNEYMGVE